VEQVEMVQELQVIQVDLEEEALQQIAEIVKRVVQEIHLL
jgi:hypothetical protein